MKKLLPLFFQTLLFCIAAQKIFPEVKWVFFAPFLTICYTSLPILPCLWLSSITGICMDMMGEGLPFGTHALIYLVVTSLLYPYRRHFVDKAIGLSIFTYLFSSLSTFLHMGAEVILSKSLPFSFYALCTDTLFFPLFDALYAFLWFSFPLLVYGYLKKQWFRFLLFRKESKRKVEPAE